MDPVADAVDAILHPEALPLDPDCRIRWLEREYAKLLRRELEVTAMEARLRQPKKGCKAKPTTQSNNCRSMSRWADDV